MKKTRVEIEIEEDAYKQILQALRRFGDYEIGGMLIGYRKGKNHFAISSATVADDSSNFSIAGFIREPVKSMKMLMRVFRKRNHNYVGEWHSHPHFRLYPSMTDVETMKGILADPDYGVNFALLLITKLRDGRVDMGGFLFHKNLPQFIEASISKRHSGNEHKDIRV